MKLPGEECEDLCARVAEADARQRRAELVDVDRARA